MIFKSSELTRNDLLKYKYTRGEANLICKAQQYFLDLNHSLDTVFTSSNYSKTRILLSVNYFANKSYNYEILCGIFLSYCLHSEKASLDYIIKEFGSELYSLATSIANIEKSESRFFDYIEISEVIKSLLNDQRIWLIKLINRYFDIINIDKIQDSNIQKNIIKQTRDVYLTIADVLQERIIKEDLEDMIFEYLEPSVRSIIVERLSYFKNGSANIVTQYSKNIKFLLLKNMIFANVKGRIKRPYSIWKKMQLKANSFEGINDLLAFRIIVNNKKSCYKALGVLHSHFSSVNTMFKDYISQPKINGYQSIHTGLLTKDDEIFEVQVRTKQMDLEANYGNSSHWVYKSGKQSLSKNYVRKINNLMSSNMLGKGYFSYENKLSEGNKVNVFTPTKTPIVLPQGATVIDFAYSIHTELGNTFDYSKVNSKDVNFSYKLQEGDIVEVFTKKNNNPQALWLNSCISSTARTEIKKYLRTQKDLSNKQKSREIIAYITEQVYSKNEEYSISAILEQLASTFNTHNYNSLYNNILSYELSHLAILSNLFKVKYNEDKISNKDVNFNEGDKSKLYLARCCYPLPGDDIIAIAVDKHNSYAVHNKNCSVYNKYKYVLDENAISWSNSSNILLKSRIIVTVLPKKTDNIYKIFKLINDMHSEVLKCNINFNNSKDMYIVDIILTIQSRNRFKELCLNIYRKCAINSLDAIDGTNTGDLL